MRILPKATDEPLLIPIANSPPVDPTVLKFKVELGAGFNVATGSGFLTQQDRLKVAVDESIIGIDCQFSRVCRPRDCSSG
ncbi:MAG: hypothetical protein R3E08_07790 [Thiotrichaceae bacterium]